jgi:hypothetical protein
MGCDSALRNRSPVLPMQAATVWDYFFLGSIFFAGAFGFARQ